MPARTLRHAILFTALLLIGGSALLPLAPRSHAKELAQFSESLQALTARVSPAVVEVLTTAYGPLSDGPGSNASLFGRRRSGGSGVILSADGYIVTNAHVVTGARRVDVVLSAPRAGGPSRSILKSRGRRVSARVVGLDTETDLAVLKVDEANLPHLSLGDSDAIQQGQIVLALGSPLGLENSVSMGVVSSVARQLRPEDRMVYLQTDAPINPGNSGGPLLDLDGRVVGINTLIFSQSGGSEGIGFAAPSNIVKHVFEEIRASGRVRRGHIGVFAQTITPALAAGLGLDQDWGVVLGDVRPGGPADLAGLAIGDVIAELDGKPMENGRQFDVNLYRRKVGSTVRLDVSRGGAKRTIQVPVVEREEDPGRFAHLVSQEQNLILGLGILAVAVNKDIVPMLPWLRQPRGIVVAARAADAPFGDEGPLQPGDVIHAINGRVLTTVEELRTVLDGLAAGAPIALQVDRRGRMQYIGLEIERR